MALPLLVSVDDFAVWLREDVTGEKIAQAEAVLSAVSGLVRSEARTTWTDGGDLTDVPPEVTTIVFQAAQRKWSNPMGFSGENDGDYSYRLDSKDAGIYLTESECKILSRYRPRSGLFTIATTRGVDEETLYAPVQGGGDLFPLLRSPEYW